MNQTLLLGIYPGLGEDQLDYVAEKIKMFFLDSYLTLDM
jgi:CDP-6-deoxy-D-xylo-4-hexulose-3-dehydrase